MSEFIKENNMHLKATRRVKLDACKVLGKDEGQFKLRRKKQIIDPKSNTKMNSTTVKLANMNRTELFEYFLTFLKDRIFPPEQLKEIKQVCREEL